MDKKILICAFVAVISLCVCDSVNPVSNVTAEYDNETSSEEPDIEMSNQTEPKHDRKHVSIHVASWRWSYVKTPLMLTIFVMCAGILKIGNVILLFFFFATTARTGCLRLVGYILVTGMYLLKH